MQVAHIVTTLKPSIPVSSHPEGENSLLAVLDDCEDEFMKAFCELLEIQSRSSGQPIVLFPDGPVTFH